MSVCLLVGAMVLTLSSPDFSLHWTHSVEKVEWVEHWQVRPDGLHLVGAAVKGSGAGMEPDDSAVLQDGWWIWQTDRKLPALELAASGATGGGWQICDGTQCLEIGAVPGRPIRLAPCTS
jgi:hypothetical protein